MEVESKRLSNKIVWVEAIIIVMIFTAPLFTISLPQVTLPGIHALDATSLLTPTYAESSRALILSEENWTEWKLNPVSFPVSLNYSAKGLRLTGEFPVNSTFLAVSISRPLAVNLTAYPIDYMLINASLGVRYGIRFFSKTAQGTALPLWVEGDALDHRPGTGQPENVQVNVVHQIAMNLGTVAAKILNTVTSVSVYVERGPSSTSTPFSLQMRRFYFLNFPLESVQSPGQYHAMYIGLNQPQVDPTTPLSSIQIQGRMNASLGTRYLLCFIRGLAVYFGQVYSMGSFPEAMSYSTSLLRLPSKSFSDNLPTGTMTIVFLALSGTLYQFGIESITLNYLFHNAQTSSPPIQNRGFYLYNVFFIVLLPSSVIILVFDHFRRRKRVKPDP